MPGTNLTRAEAERRAALLRVTSYDVDLDLTGAGATYRSTTTIRFTANEHGADTFVDLVAPAVREITLNGRPIDPATAYRDGRILVDGLAADNELRVVADCAYSNTGQGLHRTIDPVDGGTYLYTHFEVPDARRVFATFEQPDLKASVRFTVTAPQAWVVLSNSPTPRPEPVSPGVVVWRFDPTPPISTYLTAVVAGDYHLVREEYTAASGQVIPLGLACRKSMAAHLETAELFELTRQGFDYYLGAFDRPYPFAKYDQVFVPEYNIGAMENAGCVTVVESLLFRSKVTDARRQSRATTLLHEMAHMWFGDLVTPRWWDDLWLKESFATYMATRAVAAATRFTGAWTTFANTNKAWALEQDQLPTTHPIVADIADLQDVQVNFDGITYAKGAAVLRQLVAWVGDEPFLTGAREYFDRYGWGAATLNDLLGALERPSGRDLSDWSARWLRTAGPDTLAPEVTLRPDGRYDSFTVLRRAPAEHPVPRPHRVGVALYRREPAGLVRTHRIDVDITAERTPVPQFAGVRADVALVNDDDLTYARIRFDPRSLATVLTSVGEFTDPMPRALCWTAGWDMVRAAELPARTWLRMVLGGIDSEDDIGVAESLQRTLATALDYYVDPRAVPRAAAMVAESARRRLGTAAPGSDAQLSWALLLARVAPGEEDLATVSGLLDGSLVVDGLVVDTELRWALLAALARHGRRGRAEIEAELARDRTTAGTEYAAGVLAARPDAGAKRHAWASVVDRDDLPNGTVSAITGVGPASRIGLGFRQPGQDDMLEPYAGRYFQVLPAMWASRPMEIARRLVVGLYPRHRVSPDTIERTDAFLATDPAPALRRLLLEARDDIARALRARAADAAG